MNDTKLIIFDFDGTLGDTRRTIVATMQMTIAEMVLPERNEAECASTIGLPLAGCFEALFPNLKPEQVQRCAETYRRIFYENVQTIKPQAFPHVVETLSAMKQRGFTLTIASSRSHASLVELTRELGIANSISYLIGADDVEKAKPNAEPRRHILTTITMPFTNNPSSANTKKMNEKNKTQPKASMSIRQRLLCPLFFTCTGLEDVSCYVSS